MLAAMVLALLAALFQAGPQQALACSCMAIQSDESYVRDLVAQADAVIIGRVERMEKTVGRLRALVSVEWRFKGPMRSTTYVESVGDESGCGYPDLATSPYHFMALHRNSEGTLRASYCSSFPVDNAKGMADPGTRADFLATLARIAPPTRPGDGAGVSSAWIAAGFAGTLAALVALAAINRKRRER